MHCIKKALLYLSITVFCAANLFAPSTVFAAGPTFDAFTVGTLGSTSAKSIFDISETPYLYVYIPTAGLHVAGSFWHDPSGGTFQAYSPFGPTQERWLTLTNWNIVKAIGEWDIDVNAFTLDGGSNPAYGKTLSFTVTPEPLSMILFAVGGSPIALSLFRKRKKLIV